MNKTWSDKFIEAQAKPITRTVYASYVEHIARLMEGKSNKFSSIDEALTDFATRLGLSNIEMEMLKKQAMVKNAQLSLEALEDEGITDPKAIEFMSKSKGKHTKNTLSPFILNKNDGNRLQRLLTEKKQKLHPSSNTSESQNNELSTALNSTGSSEILTKFSQDLGKILPFSGSPSKESLEELRKELGVAGFGEGTDKVGFDIETPFKIARFAYKFTDMNGKFPQPGSPIKVTVFEFGMYKDKLIQILNTELRKKLAQELPFDEWIAFVTNLVKSEEISSALGWGLIQKLTSMKRQLFGDKDSPPFFIEEGEKRISRSIKELIGYFPVSYRKVILELMAKGEYRHLLARASESRHEQIFSTGYRKASFVLMQSFAPFKTLSFSGSKEQRAELLRAVIEKAKASGGSTAYSFEEFRALLNSLDISFEEVPSTNEEQSIKIHSKIPPLQIKNIKNDSYKPTTYEGDLKSPEEQEKLLASFHDNLTQATQSQLPLAYVPKDDGSIEPVFLEDMVKGYNKVDLTSPQIEGKEKSLNNPKTGLHPSFEGVVEQKTTRSNPKTDFLEPSTPTSDSSLQSLLDKIKKKKQASYKIAGTELWMDSTGAKYSSAQEVAKAFHDAALQSLNQNEIVSQVVNSLLGEVPNTSLPIKKQEERPSKEEEKLPLAAHSLLRLKKLAVLTKNKQLKAKLSKLIRR
jgi:hypothetical protein